ncbi:MAG: hypothetical protein HYW06_05780 [Gemmatimonadetes bacterium]|nr:hypothetical protein [Gemmatimonadota bacterium]MBI2536465.1 hypothetical protein [Gemmatimonadota bacterium]
MALDIVRTLRLPDSEFFSGTQRKTGIAIHHTVGTAYLIDHDGTVFEVLDYYGDRLAGFEGVIGHAMIRPDLLLAAVGVALIVVNTVGGNRAAIALARAEAAQLTHQRDSLVTGVRRRDQAQTALQVERETHEAAAEAYQGGYRTAYATYQDLSKRHIAELKKPRIRLRSALGLLGAVGVGAVVGRAIP